MFSLRAEDLSVCETMVREAVADKLWLVSAETGESYKLHPHCVQFHTSGYKLLSRTLVKKRIELLGESDWRPVPAVELEIHYLLHIKVNHREDRNQIIATLISQFYNEHAKPSEDDRIWVVSKRTEEMSLTGRIRLNSISNSLEEFSQETEFDMTMNVILPLTEKNHE